MTTDEKIDALLKAFALYGDSQLFENTPIGRVCNAFVPLSRIPHCKLRLSDIPLRPADGSNTK